MTNKDKFLNLLGLATKAGKLVSGDDTTVKAVRKNNVRLVIVATDASEGTIKKMTDKCQYYQTPIIVACTKAEISHAIGKSRTIIGVCDNGFSKKMRELLKDE
ncbi:YlxQ-related RNA-binding protein [Vagococcus hydrophili]|uniref:YlxQ-related RNA-binding protein n=1 Tax=Vagococcus hydrophili TaxID=2714947 RepID=A0A6G8AX12_9ENTE|nr:YlxQ-related RNA-binding protein [Vagococcus hydrophili]QIL49520.1 YlxQ-related RNA-binding protein [Vagococcus hydrophili]